MTDKQAYLLIRQLGLAVWKRDGEWRVDYRKGDARRSSGSCYFTTDRDDAIGTAKVMAEWRVAE